MHFNHQRSSCASDRGQSSLTKHTTPFRSECEEQSHNSLFSRGEIYIQLFHFSGLVRAGMWDQAPLLNAIDKQEFCCVITEFSIQKKSLSESDIERFTPEIIAALRKKYNLLEAVYPYYFYVPAGDSVSLKTE